MANNFCDVLFVSLGDESLLKGSNIKVQNLLSEKQIYQEFWKVVSTGESTCLHIVTKQR